MTESSKIEFRYRRIRELEDITDLVAILFPSNRNQQYAAARILMLLRVSDGLTPSLSVLESRYRISRRTLQRTRAKLAQLGLIEHHTWMNNRHPGQSGWELSGRMSRALRQLAERVESWKADTRPDRQAKDEQLTEVIHRSSPRRSVP